MFDIQVVAPGDFPPVPFEFFPHVRVIDAEKWLTRLKEDAAREKSPRTKWGALQADVKRAEEIWNLENTKRKRKPESSTDGSLDVSDYF